MIRIGGGDLKVLPMDGKQLVSPLDSADLFVVDHDSLTAQLLAQTPIAVAGKLPLEPLDVITQLSVVEISLFYVGCRLIVETARCQLHDLESLSGRAKLCAVITEVLTFLRWAQPILEFLSGGSQDTARPLFP